MKKNILFVMPDLECGGAQKSLVTLLNCINYKEYEVDLFLFQQTGDFMDMIPEEVNLLQSSKYWDIINSSFVNSILKLIINFRFDLVIARIAQTIICRKYKNALGEQKFWKFINSAFSKMDKEYDVAIGYMEKNPIYFSVDKVKARKKIGWIHTNYGILKHSLNFEEKYFNKLDYIVTVSDECAEILKKLFIKQVPKVRVIENIILPSLINKMANEKVLENNKHFKIVTVARLAPPKGIDIALEACKILVEDRCEFIWYVIGDGIQHKDLDKKIYELELENNFKLLGTKPNPYPYIKEADIYVQPSRYEGKSIAIEEAKILSRPIVVTNYKTVKDQIDNEVNGVIVETNSKGIYEGIKKLMYSSELRNRLSNNLKNENSGNEFEVEKLYKLLNA